MRRMDSSQNHRAPPQHCHHRLRPHIPRSRLVSETRVHPRGSRLHDRYHGSCRSVEGMALVDETDHESDHSGGRETPRLPAGDADVLGARNRGEETAEGRGRAPPG